MLALRQRILKAATSGVERKHLAMPTPDARPYPQEVDSELFWVDRLSHPGHWPHTGYGDAPAPVPGLRYEVWYFQKREACLLTLLQEAHPALADLTPEMDRLFLAFVEEGRYAKRYQPVPARTPEAELILRVAPNSHGIWRSAPIAEEKLAKALETLITDTQPAVTKLLTQVDPSHSLVARLREAVAERDPLAELKARFGKGGA
jgi:hypothetical protein